jgi:hypothetical protein
MTIDTGVFSASQNVPWMTRLRRDDPEEVFEGSEAAKVTVSFLRVVSL